MAKKEDDDLPESLMNMLNIPMQAEREPVVIPENPADDFMEMRARMYKLYDKLDRSIDTLMDISDASQHPSAFEKISMLGKTMKEVAETTMNVTKMHKDIHEKKGEQVIKGDVTQNILVAPSADVFAAIRAQLNKPTVIDGSDD